MFIGGIGRKNNGEEIILLAHTAYEDRTDSVLKLRHIKFRCRGITQHKAYSIQNMAKVCNPE